MNTISAELLQTIEARAEPKNSWEGYATVLRYLQNAVLRVPTQAMIEQSDIDRIFSIELHYIAALVSDIFSGEGMDELESYLYDPIP
jgi:hypothetical protein